jgi:hypothetical protein
MPSWCALSRRTCSNFGRDDLGGDLGEDFGGDLGGDFGGILRRRLSIAILSGTGGAGEGYERMHECMNAQAVPGAG